MTVKFIVPLKLLLTRLMKFLQQLTQVKFLKRKQTSETFLLVLPMKTSVKQVTFSQVMT